MDLKSGNQSGNHHRDGRQPNAHRIDGFAAAAWLSNGKGIAER